MTTLQEFQSFTAISKPDQTPSLEWMLWLRDLQAVLTEMQAQIADLEARVTALEP